MRDPARIDQMLELLRDYWHAHPDLRLGQILESARTESHRQRMQSSMFFVEDDRLAEGLARLP